MAEQRDNSGVAFKNEDRKTEKHPIYSGPGMIGGKEGRIAIWNKTDRNGKTFLTWAWTPNEEAEMDQRRDDERGGGGPADENDIPF